MALELVGGLVNVVVIDELLLQQVALCLRLIEAWERIQNLRQVRGGELMLHMLPLADLAHEHSHGGHVITCKQLGDECLHAKAV